MVTRIFNILNAGGLHYTAIGQCHSIVTHNLSLKHIRLQHTTDKTGYS